MTPEEKLHFYTSVAAALIRRVGGLVFISGEELAKTGSVMWQEREEGVELKVTENGRPN